jgi:hypothetical protein
MTPNDPSSQPKPRIVDELYDVGLVFYEAGPGTRVYMRVDRPGEFFDGQMRPVSERVAAKVGFPVAYWRDQRRASDIQRSAAAHADRIRAASAEHLKSPEDKREERTEALRAQAAKAIRAHEKLTQAKTDKQLTQWLEQAQPR